MSFKYEVCKTNRKENAKVKKMVYIDLPAEDDETAEVIVSSWGKRYKFDLKEYIKSEYAIGGMLYFE